MLLTLTTTHQPATDLGYLLHKNPARVQEFNLAFGQAHVFYPESNDQRCTAALLLEINPVRLVRGQSDFALEQYVNDRPYVASSFLSVAIAHVYGSALNGNCKDRPELVRTPIPLEANLTGVPSRGGEALLHALFEPLGYTVELDRYPLDTAFPAWGDGHYYDLKLTGTITLSALLSHLYVLIPVLDNRKHYFVGDDEVQKLLKHGEGWLSTHPAKVQITERYLKYRRNLTIEAMSRLVVEEIPAVDEAAASEDAAEAAGEERINLHDQRLGTVLAVLKSSGVRRVLDLGCGEGKLLSLLLKEPQFSAILGMDVSNRTLEVAADRLKLERLPPSQRERISLVQGSLMYRDPRLTGFEAAAVVEVIEHLDPPRLAAFERALFEFARPALVIITTPNAEYNVMWESLPAGNFRHKDHRFEWTRAEFEAWAGKMAERFGYQVRFLPIGPEAQAVGAPTQMSVFELKGAS